VLASLVGGSLAAGLGVGRLAARLVLGSTAASLGVGRLAARLVLGSTAASRGLRRLATCVVLRRPKQLAALPSVLIRLVAGARRATSQISEYARHGHSV